MSDKRALLDAAIQTYDGNCIMAVLIFMRKTVNQSKWTMKCYGLVMIARECIVEKMPCMFDHLFYNNTSFHGSFGLPQLLGIKFCEISSQCPTGEGVHVECEVCYLSSNCSHSAGYVEEEGGGRPPLHQLPQAAQGLEGATHTLWVSQWCNI